MGISNYSNRFDPFSIIFLFLFLFLSILYPYKIKDYSSFVDWRTIIALTGLLIITTWIY